MLSAQKIDHYRSIIEQQLSETLRALEMADAADAGIVQLDQTRVGRLSRMDAMQQQAMSQSLKARLVQHQRRLEAALARIRDGSFGVCCDCGDELDEERLETEPAAPFCADCQDEIEAKRQR
ncbi:MAG: TraR/DksA family transcriptional regulator [Methylobacter sp.]|uniref:TraR/DksA family transcriptional regulator n=1 Tax=Methylobacter sp. TaxID=2051955 RepID=UPI00258CEC5D|nr:TraR/DksA C4-type zinc finger protein [Methylobacter sp.]MCL7423390.1 TraR/DksA family transcriptional regulator [Methylobacter sp.]